MTPDNHRDKRIEFDRYETRAKKVLSTPIADSVRSLLGPDGAEGIAVELRAPYLFYEAQIRTLANPGSKVLDLCCGNGLHSLVAAHKGAAVTASDIAPANLELTKLRAERAGLQISVVVADAEKLPFTERSFDLVACAGSLSYVNLEVFLTEVKRVLKPGGYFVCVDSLNHNPLYRFNRYLHYRRGDRSLSIIERTPTVHTIATLRCHFSQGAQHHFFGVFSFLSPILKPMLGASRTAKILDRLDRALPWLGRFGFKFVFAGTLPN